MDYEVVAVWKDQNGNILGVDCGFLNLFKTATVVNMRKQGHRFHVRDDFGNLVEVKHYTVHNKTFIKTAANNQVTDNLDNLIDSLWSAFPHFWK
jgi:hypothetical protein